ncbi:hypothetical protein Pmani_004481 [Petrolisthes manimaculis]|uniref:Uncharacterized protein n=1 Tax=Petrolisthes manimaculis TaxID=1843537 RepID=A0AAE1QET5_9EUCA|nr:hypothetical protein Pmani_004481 [Petrolisthes manimaculis]
MVRQAAGWWDKSEPSLLDNPSTAKLNRKNLGNCLTGKSSQVPNKKIAFDFWFVPVRPPTLSEVNLPRPFKSSACKVEF